MKDNQAKLESLYQKALRVGLATDQGFDAELVRKLTDKHRELHGFSKAKVFKVYPSLSACQRENLHKGVDAASAFHGQTDISWLILAEAGKKDGGAGDHLALTVPKGVYKVSIVREWDYLFHEARRVID